MKIEDMYIFIPTRGNVDFMHDMAKSLQKAKLIIFLATEVDVEDKALGDNCKIVYGGRRWEKRNHAVQLAGKLGLDYCVQIDDDIRAKDIQQLAETVTTTLLENEWLGAACSLQAVMFRRGWYPKPISHPFSLRWYPNGLFAIRVDAYNETQGYRLQTCDDTDMGAQLWQKGWPIATIPQGHEEVRRRGEVGKGGLPESEYWQGRQSDLAILHTMPEIIRHAEDRKGPNGEQHIYIRWHWKRMMSNFWNRFHVPYRDDKRSVGYAI